MIAAPPGANKDMTLFRTANQRPGGFYRARSRPEGRVLRCTAQYFGVPGRHGRSDGRSDRGTLDPKIEPTDDQAQAAGDLIRALRAYLK
jgi:hypothetical protein